MSGFHSSSVLFALSIIFFYIFSASHTHIEMLDSDNKIDITITELKIQRNAWIMTIAKTVALISLYCFCLLIFSGRFQFLQRFLKNYLFNILAKIMYEIILFLPFISKSFLGVNANSMTSSKNWGIFISLFALVLSSLSGFLLYIFVE